MNIFYFLVILFICFQNIKALSCSDVDGNGNLNVANTVTSIGNGDFNGCNNSISTIEDLEEIRLTEVGKNELENDLIKLMPKQVSKILFINEFKYMDKTTIEDNLKRIEEYKKER